MPTKKIIAMSAPVTITAAETDGDKQSPPKFAATFYTGGAMNIEGWDLPVVIDLAALDSAKVLVANLDHDQTKRVGNFSVANDGKSLVATGTAHPDAFPAAKEVVSAGLDGYQWQASLEVNPKRGGVNEIKKGKTAQANGQTFEGPLYIVQGTLKGFGFVSHGADDNTTASIAASAAPSKEKNMKAECKTWIEGIGFDISTLTPDQLSNLEADYEGRSGTRKPAKVAANDPFAEVKAESTRKKEINQIAASWAAKREDDADWVLSMEKLRDHAIDAKMSVQDFRNALYEQAIPVAHTVAAPREGAKLNARVLQAAICQAGRLANLDKHFKDQELQAAHDEFGSEGISLNQFLFAGAEANGYRGRAGGIVNREILRAAFNNNQPLERRTIQATGFSTIDVANIVGAVANKFLHEGWMHVDMTPLRIARVKSVRNFQQITTVSLTGHLQYEKLGPAGEIKHGQLDEKTYTNQVDTYAAMLAITRQDIINDDLGALTAAPRRLGRGAALMLNHIFWTEFLGLVAANFFAAGNSNINTGVADMTVGGLDATETIFMNQTDPDGKPVGFMPKILLVPTALKNKAITLMESEKATYGATYATAPGDGNPFRSRFNVESSPYISNSTYTGNTSTAWWMLADPNDEAVIEIAALNGRVEPTVETADADFNVLGIQMRGVSDVGVNEQEFRAGVHADGGSS